MVFSNTVQYSRIILSSDISLAIVYICIHLRVWRASGIWVILRDLRGLKRDSKAEKQNVAHRFVWLFFFYLSSDVQLRREAPVCYQSEMKSTIETKTEPWYHPQFLLATNQGHTSEDTEVTSLVFWEVSSTVGVWREKLNLHMVGGSWAD